MDRSTGETLNGDCECPVGKELHGACKHFAAVLLIPQHFTETGSVVIEKRCTDYLHILTSLKQPTMVRKIDKK